MTLADFRVETLDLVPDAAGRLVASLLHSPQSTDQRPAVLYLHGFIDYFFQVHLAEAMHRGGYDFYALDLRRCGHAYLPHQRFNYCAAITEYFEEIDLAVERIQTKNAAGLYLMAHSTGGLTACRYLQAGRLRGAVQALVLNSPFLAIPRGSFLTKTLYGISKLAAKLSPDSHVQAPTLYAQTVSTTHYGEWTFNTAWKPVEGFPLYFQWVLAVIDAQEKLEQSDVEVPTLLLHASHSLRPTSYEPEVRYADIVLDVEDMKRIGPTLGPRVEMVEIKNGMHDLILSPSPIRERALATMVDWLQQQ
ncbi:MAG: alpha/beta hydrolase [Bacteroidota bacterium]